MTGDILTFNADDVTAWAKFSGDYNPVHFDDRFAQDLGLSGRIAHGMRVMLDLKQRIDRLAYPDLLEKGGWWSCDCRLKAAIPLNIPARFQSGLRGEDRTFSLNILDGPKAITGIFRPIEVPVFREEDFVGDKTISTLTEARIGRRLGDLAVSFGWVHSSWIAVDALLFDVFLGFGIDQALRPMGLNLGRDGWGALSTSGKVVLQTGHGVAFDSDFFKIGASGFAPHRLEIEAMMPESTTTAGDTFIARRWRVRHDDRVVMRTEIRLVVRTISPFATENLR